MSNLDNSETISLNHIIEKIKNNVSVSEYSATSSGTMLNNTLSATSIKNMTGGVYSHSQTQSQSQSQDVSQLVAMLTSETGTETLENKLHKDLELHGGASVNSIKHFFNQLKSQGVKVDIKLNDLTLSEYYDNEPKTMVGGLNAALEAFQKLRSGIAKVLADKLNIKGIKVSAKLASKIKNEVQEKHKDEKDPMKIANLGLEHFNKNLDRFLEDAKVMEKEPSKKKEKKQKKNKKKSSSDSDL